MYFDGPWRVKKLMMDAERLIRLRGLPYKKSYKLRVLHHMYTHLRVVIESTNLSQSALAEPPHPTDLVAAPPRSPFRIPEIRLGKADYLRTKPDEMGYNDIHLQEPGRFPMTMFPDIYGVPESLLSLHAHTISLANGKPALDRAAARDPAVERALGTHVRSLEAQIWSWTPEDTSAEGWPPPWARITADTPPSFAAGNAAKVNGGRGGAGARNGEGEGEGDGEGNDDDQQRRSPLLSLAFQQSLIIYFYRRVYNPSALLLQDSVRRALDHVLPFLELGRCDQDFGITVAWTLFVAACEAATPELEARAAACLEAIDHCGVFVEACRPSETARAVWARRRETGDFSCSWPDLIREGVGVGGEG